MPNTSIHYTQERKETFKSRKNINVKYQFCRYLVNIFCVSEHSQGQCFLNFNVRINNRIGLGFRVLHIWHAPRCRPCCRSLAHTWSSKGEPTSHREKRQMVGDRTLMINLHTCCFHALGFIHGLVLYQIPAAQRLNMCQADDADWHGGSSYKT